MCAIAYHSFYCFIKRTSSMKPVFLDFEQPIAELNNKIEELRFVQGDSALDISDEIERLQKKSHDLAKSIFSKLSPAQISQVSRHPQRPYTLDYIDALCTDFGLCLVIVAERVLSYLLLAKTMEWPIGNP